MLIELQPGLSIDPSKVVAVQYIGESQTDIGFSGGYDVTTELPYDEVLLAIDTAKYPTGAQGRARNRAIITAVEQGQTYRQVADYYGLTYQRVHQICNAPGLELRRADEPVGN